MFDAVARIQAKETYAGVYEVVDAKLGGNTTIVLDVDDGPGLRIQEFVSREVDLLGLLKDTISEGHNGVLVARLYSTSVKANGGGGEKEYWRMAWEFTLDESSKMNESETGAGKVRRGLGLPEGFTVKRAVERGVLGGVKREGGFGRRAVGGGNGGEPIFFRKGFLGPRICCSGGGGGGGDGVCVWGWEEGGEKGSDGSWKRGIEDCGTEEGELRVERENVEEERRGRWAGFLEWSHAELVAELVSFYPQGVEQIYLLNSFLLKTTMEVLNIDAQLNYIQLENRTVLRY